jgi:hypothetical protein
LDEKVNKILGVFIALMLVVIGVLVAMSNGTVLSVKPPVTAIGMKTPVKVEVQNPHGIRRLTAYVEQGGARYPVFQHEASSSHRIFFFHHKDAPQQIDFTAGKGNAPNLKDGKARLIIEAVSNDFRGRTDSVEYDVEVATAPPRVVADGFQHYVNQGGMEVATFTPAGYWTDAGVKVGKYTFRSFPVPGRPGERFAMFAYPWDLGPDDPPYVYATNPTGIVARGTFWYKIFPRKFRVRDFELTDAIMEKLVNQIDPTGTGPLLERFLKINGELRRQNNKTLADQRFKTEEKILWNGPFIRLGKEEAMFADVRNYIYQGKKVDQQVHLGYDLSDVQHVAVRAANDGRVVYASDLGIYGNCIVLDHGYGLQSIYGHLSSLDVKPGDMVKKGQTMGHSGATGLALGDHLHFSMQVDGVQINPVEWWDEHWIRDRVLSKLNPAAAPVH